MIKDGKFEMDRSRPLREQECEFFEEIFMDAEFMFRNKLDALHQRCSVCGSWCAYFVGTKRNNYCSNCGAKVKR